MVRQRTLPSDWANSAGPAAAEMRRKRCLEPGVHRRSLPSRSWDREREGSNSCGSCGGVMRRQRGLPGGPLECQTCKNGKSRYILRQRYIAEAPISQLAGEGVLHEVTTARLCDYLWGEGLPTSGLMQDIVDRCYEHLGRGQRQCKAGSPDDSDVEILSSTPATSGGPEARRNRGVSSSPAAPAASALRGDRSSSCELGSGTDASLQAGPDLEIVDGARRFGCDPAPPPLKKTRTK